MSIETAPPRFPVSILVLAWNSAAHLLRCLEALSLQTYKDFDIVIVDNGSEDDALNALQEKHPALHLHVHRLDSNLGFSIANNIGARLARGQWIALLNADAFPEPDWLERLLEAAEKYPNAFFTSRQIQADNPTRLDGEGDVYHVSGLAWRRNYNLPVYPLNENQEVFSACGAAALFPRQEFLDAGGFDEDYFSYHEDVDLGFRLRLRGLRCVFVPQAIVHHVGSASTGKRSDFSVYHGHRNLVWTYFKDMPAALFWFYLPLHIAINSFFLIYFSFKGQGRAIWRAKWDALRGLPAMLKKRQAIQLGRKISIAELHQIMSRNWLTPFITAIKRRNG
ncbi:MAG: glycosyltransferase family 2 protein [Chloroflexi bacterium]|nr:glycosyltransferase family 2 protein [Chloroflexota bacterium]